MKKKFCAYCGKLLNEKCGCIVKVENKKKFVVTEYYNSPETHYGWRQDDLITMNRREY